MKKRILPILLAVSPYIYVFIVCSVFARNLPLTTTSLKQILLSYFIMVLIVYLPNCVFAFLSPNAGVQLTQLAFWNMVIKLFHIPFYIVVFVFGGLLTVALFLFGGPILALILAIMDFLLMLTSSTFGFSTLKQARKHNLLDSRAVGTYTICHFIFCADAISAVMLYKKVKAAILKPTH